MFAFFAENLAPIMFLSLIVVLLLGYPVAFALAFVGFIFGFIGIEMGLLPVNLFGAIPDDARVARDGNIITGGGVTAGIDFALTVLAEIAGDDVAQAIQLGLEYAPAPPFNAGRPEIAPPSILAQYEARLEKTKAARWTDAEAAAGMMKAPSAAS